MTESNSGAEILEEASGVTLMAWLRSMRLLEATGPCGQSESDGYFAREALLRVV